MNKINSQGIEFVEDFVQRYPGAVVVVSHDRAFLDAIATSIVEVADGVANRWKGNFSHYCQQRALALRQATGDRPGVALYLGNLGSIHHLLGDREKALAAGCDDYFAKPIEVDEFVRFMRPYLEVR